MPRDDQLFYEDMDALDLALRDAVPAAGVDDPWGISEAFGSRLSEFQRYYYYFRGLGKISGGTELVTSRIEGDVIPILGKYKQDGSFSTLKTIEDKLDGWEGPSGSASFLFRTEYMPGLARSLAEQCDFMISMATVMRSHEEVINQARQKYLDLMDNTVAGLDASRRARRQPAAELSVTDFTASVGLAFTVGGVIAGPFGAAAGVVWGAVVGSIEIVGRSIDAASTEAPGASPIEILDNSLIGLESLVRSVQEEARSIESMLDAVLAEIDGEFQDDFVAPSVNVGGLSPVGG